MILKCSDFSSRPTFRNFEEFKLRLTLKVVDKYEVYLFSYHKAVKRIADLKGLDENHDASNLWEFQCLKNYWVKDYLCRISNEAISINVEEFLT